ncbi:hypothetical protein MHA_1081 [Mannheimia haemolytica PHL213]|nr:hypothetical protein MHA_1081 [Mannheimia haemolytica PHL213]
MELAVIASCAKKIVWERLVGYLKRAICQTSISIFAICIEKINFRSDSKTLS